MQIAGHTFLVTGGASGLGLATARALVGNGGNVLIADLDREGGAGCTGELGNGSLFVRADVVNETQVREAIRTGIDKFGELHGLVNCAGIVVAERVLKKDGSAASLESFRRAIEVNLIGTFNAVRLAAEVMAGNKPDNEGERGVIVNTASIAAYEGQIGQAGYAASKAGVIGLTLPVARELARVGIRVVAVAPGLFDTPLFGSLPETVRKSLAAGIPFPRRPGKPEEFAALVQHILANPMLNGAIIRLDGALRMGPT